MTVRYRLTPIAQDNIEAICAFIADDSADAALRVLSWLEQAFEQLAETPEIGHTREDLTDRPVKFWRVFSYLIVYEPTSVPLAVIAVLHGARDLEHILRDLDR